MRSGQVRAKYSKVGWLAPNVGGLPEKLAVRPERERCVKIMRHGGTREHPQQRFLERIEKRFFKFKIVS